MKNEEKSYFELIEHNTLQVIIFLLILIISIIVVFNALLPFADWLVTEQLGGDVYNKGQTIEKGPDNNKLVRTNHYLKWAVDIINADNEVEARYWINPVFSLAIPTTLISIIITVIFTSVLSRKLGLMRQKIERELVFAIEKISFKINGFHSAEQRKEVISEILNADLRDLHDYQQKWGYTVEELKILHKVLKWRDRGLLYKLFNFGSAAIFYMRFYFTDKFGNAMLGSVYIGAAVLIVIIGLRGLKLIPSTEPSPVFFALGLEFSLLLTYATTLMFSKSEEEEANEQLGNSDNLFLSNDFGNSKEVERLLRVYIKSPKKDKDNP